MNHAADRLQAHAEVVKLARLLGRDPDDLAYLERLGADDLRALRDAITQTLYDAHGSALSRLASASRLLPAGLTATIGQHAFGPLLSARLAGLLDADKAIDVATKLPPAFLADVAVELDPRRASTLIGGIAPELIGKVTAELVARQEHVTMGRFVGHLSDEAVDAALATMDDATMLEVAFVLEDRGDLGRLLARLDHARFEAILDMVIERHLWSEVLLLAEHDDHVQERLADRLRALPARRRREAAKRAREADALERLPVLAEALSV